jgi:hypothetical protein
MGNPIACVFPAESVFQAESVFRQKGKYQFAMSYMRAPLLLRIAESVRRCVRGILWNYNPRKVYTCVA